MKETLTAATTGALLVALSALGYATNPIFGKVAYGAGANAISLGAIRFVLAASSLWAYLSLSRQLRPLPFGRRARLVGLGVMMSAVSLLYFTALEHIAASLATGLFYTYPATVTVMGLFRGEGVNRYGVAGLLLTAAGTWMLLGLQLNGFTWMGATLIIVGSILYSVFIVVGDSWTGEATPTETSAHVTAGSAVVYLLILAVSRPPVPGALAFAGGAGLALCSTILALVTFYAGLPRVGPTRASIISTLEPVFTILLAVSFLGDRMTPLQTAGIALVVAGAVAAQLRVPKVHTT